ncbi:DUF2235 domain-containing protein [Methylobacterium oxalidis]|uniref:DUF2235 domain-containing protein n=1 Tax=Methylobacterium oxalidis TaxID=944322 RepID=UPI0033147723
MPKNVVVFSDGTGQDGGARPEQRLSNVYKLYRACRVGPDSAVDPREQVTFYDPGLGTDIGATAMTAPVRFVQKLLASMTGRGITANVADCYAFIINHYAPGDRIFLIGFSRGAYTVRCVANLLTLCGVPTRMPDGAPLPLFRKATRDIAREAVDTVLEHGAGHPRESYAAEREELARRFRARHGSNHVDSDRRSNVAPYFIGTFDTVAALGVAGAKRSAIKAAVSAVVAIPLAFASVLVAATLAGLLHLVAGWPFWWTALALVLLEVGLLGWAAWRILQAWRASMTKTIRDFPNKGDVSTHLAEWKGANFDRFLSAHVGYARAAIAIDERRKDFARVPWGTVVDAPPRDPGLPEQLVQVWFAGNHSDIGGSYIEPESRLSDITLRWMIEEATRLPEGLKVDGLRAPGDAMGNPRLRLFPRSDGVQHCEIAGMRDTIEERTLAAFIPAWLRRRARGKNWEEQDREVPHDAVVHPTVDERFALPSVVQCAGSGPYRPGALANHGRFKGRYGADEAGQAVGAEASG